MNLIELEKNRRIIKQVQKYCFHFCTNRVAYDVNYCPHTGCQLHRYRTGRYNNGIPEDYTPQDAVNEFCSSCGGQEKDFKGVKCSECNLFNLSNYPGSTA